jgi:hypothetical protein
MGIYTNKVVEGCDQSKLLWMWQGALHLHLSHLADALIQSDLQIGAFTL